MYRLVYREREGDSELWVEMASEPLVKIKSERAGELFSKLIRIIGRTGAITPIQTGNPKIYEVRDDAGPVIAAYLVLVKGAKDLDYWISFLEELLEGRLSILGGLFTVLLEYMMQLSRGYEGPGLHPQVEKAFSAAMKTLIKHIYTPGE